jgi:hypothetical protein
MSREIVDLDLYFVAETALAYGVTESDPKDPVIWLPKSQVESNARPGDLGKVRNFEVPEWLATEKGLV